MVGALCVTWLVFYVLLTVFMVQQLHMNDFGRFYYSARLFLDGQDMYGPSPATEIPVGERETRQLLNMNPPHFHLLMLPFAMLDPTNAFLLWMALNLVALCLSFRAISQELQIRWTRARLAWTAAAVILCSATGAVVATGQLTFLLLLPVTLAWIAARHNNWSRAAAYLGVCASIKPFLGIFLLWLILRRVLTPVVVMVVSALLCNVIGLQVFGWTTYENWLGALASVEWTWLPMNGSLAALVSRAFADTPLYAPALSAPWLIEPVTTVLAFVVGFVAFRLLQSGVASVDQAFACLLLSAQLVSPLGWIYYLWLMVGPAAAVCQTWKPAENKLRDGLVLLAIPGLVIPFAFTVAGSASPFLGLTFGSIYVWTTLFLWGSLIVDWRMESGVFAMYPISRTGQVAAPSVRHSPRIDVGAR